jgi:formate/nitrite transporter FocA (FNT family)
LLVNFLFVCLKQPPPALYQGAVAAGVKKAQNSFGNIFTLGIVAGCHIAFGAFLAISVGGACPGIAKDNPGLQKVITLGDPNSNEMILVYLMSLLKT